MKAAEVLKRLLRNEKGTETVEWAIIIGIIAVGALGAIALIGPWVTQQFWDLAGDLNIGGGGG